MGGDGQKSTIQNSMSAGIQTVHLAGFKALIKFFFVLVKGEDVFLPMIQTYGLLFASAGYTSVSKLYHENKERYLPCYTLGAKCFLP